MKSYYGFILFLVGMVPAHGSSWTIDYAQLIASESTEPNAVLLGDACKAKGDLVGTTFGRVADPAGDPPDIFRARYGRDGQLGKLVQWGRPQGQYLRGAVRSWLGTETLLEADTAKGTWEVARLSKGGKEKWRAPMIPGHGPTTGLVRNFWGAYWLATRPTSFSEPYSLSKLNRDGTWAWTRPVGGAEALGVPRILRRNRDGDLVTGVPIFQGAGGKGRVDVACYDSEARHKWTTVLSQRYGIARDIAFDPSGRMLVLVVYYDDPQLGWHTRLWMLAPGGAVLGSVRVEGHSLSGWRLATDKQGHIYVGSMEYGEPGYPVLSEFDPSLKLLSRHVIDHHTTVFINSLQVSPDGEQVMMAGSAASRWFGKPTRGPSDAFVLRCRRNAGDVAGAEAPFPDFSNIVPRRATEEEYPW